ncbi:MAG TPA: MoxR family ATPase [Casimicrobium huifangae]|jgi:MoxR-like ATPase|uniref:AAA family ATPase n=1 Tax=Casimicrobium huifangae TaxID=2591109 RepID=UPI0012EBA398|nr:MoxR family ATPase [Casimicrobium huifangae]HOB00408.1 MoxR family ATPase [Casimicrobium huifangae]HQA32494.1 MoxR family ATPase [Casimicrobium huifangae]HQD65616.1 MoxR family ATPase [Casimicrobium huifangae]
MQTIPESIDATQALLSSADYIADRELATTVFLALKMQRPLFLEGDAGVGKTEVAKALSGALGRELIRLQCYEGLDVSQAAYEWNVQRQLFAVRAREGALPEEVEATIYGPQYLIKRPLLRALESMTAASPVLLIDELDRADEPFEAYLLEVLSDFQLTIPELGTVRATTPPIVVITSNRTREIHDAIKRRCLYYWVDYPTLERELAIVRRKLPGVNERLSLQIVKFIQRLRREELFKLPGVAETIDWTRALTALDVLELSPQNIADTLGVLLKYQDDIAKLRTQIDSVLADASN